MPLTAEQLRIASQIDARMQKLVRAGKDDVTTILAEMADHMPQFKRLMDTAQPGDMDELARKFTGFFHYATILKAIAAAIHSGAITLPR
jgi:streptomycin 6-kinase